MSQLESRLENVLIKHSAKSGFKKETFYYDSIVNGWFTKYATSYNGRPFGNIFIICLDKGKGKSYRRCFYLDHDSHGEPATYDEAIKAVSRLATLRFDRHHLFKKGVDGMDDYVRKIVDGRASLISQIWGVVGKEPPND